MRWKEAAIRSARTFFQSLSGVLPAMTFAFNRSFIYELGVALIASAWSAFVSFAMNVVPPTSSDIRYALTDTGSQDHV